jgi:hypothetical protein
MSEAQEQEGEHGVGDFVGFLVFGPIRKARLNASARGGIPSDLGFVVTGFDNIDLHAKRRHLFCKRIGERFHRVFAHGVSGHVSGRENTREQALFEPNPKRRYLVVPNQGEAERTIKTQIEQLVQLNEGQPYTYDREALIKMLDEVLAQARPRTK